MSLFHHPDCIARLEMLANLHEKVDEDDPDGIDQRRSLTTSDDDPEYATFRT